MAQPGIRAHWYRWAMARRPTAIPGFRPTARLSTKTRLVSYSRARSRAQLSSGLEQAVDDSRHALPVSGFCQQLLTAGFRQRVILGLAVVIGNAPLGADPAT